MNEQLQNEAAALIETLREGVVAASGFAAEQMPEVCRQMVLLGRAYFMLAVLGVVVFVLAGIGVGQVAAKNIRDDDDHFGAPLQAGVAAGLITAAMFAGGGAINMLSAWIAPKVYLLERLAGMVK